MKVGYVEVDPAEPLVLSFPAPGSAPTINYLTGKHWAQRERVLKPWREWTQLAYWKVKRTALAQSLVGQPAEVLFTLPFRDRRKRDPHNYIGSVVKACIDQLVHDGFWPDDDPRYVRILEPELIVDPSEEREARIWIWRRRDA